MPQQQQQQWCGTRKKGWRNDVISLCHKLHAVTWVALHQRTARVSASIIQNNYEKMSIFCRHSSFGRLFVPQSLQFQWHLEIGAHLPSHDRLAPRTKKNLRDKPRSKGFRVCNSTVISSDQWRFYVRAHLSSYYQLASQTTKQLMRSVHSRPKRHYECNPWTK